MKSIFFLLCTLFIFNTVVKAQKPATDNTVIVADTTLPQKSKQEKKDSAIESKKTTTLRFPIPHNPKTATLRSLAIPGWGQVYNKEYWKLPIIYGALGTAAGIYFYNNTWYKRTRDAYNIRVNNDTANFASINPKLEPLPASALLVYRNSFRRDRDFSALWFVLLWGLNIVDATVFAHLKSFDVGSDLSLNVQPRINTNGSTGLSLVLGYRSPQKPHIFNVR